MAKQQVLTVKIDDNTIVSKPFDFEALCLVDDERFSGGGATRQGYAAVSYLFEGTAVTESVLQNLSNQKRVAMARQVYKWYVEEITESLKNENCPPE